MIPYYQDEAVVIYHGDCRDVLLELLDSSVDLVLTDPPYGNGCIEDYEFLAKEAARLLKPHQFCCVYSGTIYLPEIIAAMNKYLKWFWLHNLRHRGQYTRVWGKHIHQNSKPILSFTRGKAEVPKLIWTLTDYTSDKPDKRFHSDLGQGINVPLRIILDRSEADNLVLDPFMGGGTFPFAAKMLGRKAIGIEIEERYCEIAANRCRQMVFDLKE